MRTMDELEMQIELIDFKFMARNFPQSSRRTQLGIIGQCLYLKHLEQIINLYKDGWLGLEGNLARVVARMLSHFE